MSYQTYNVTGRNGYTIYNIQAKTSSEARREFKAETGEAAMKVEKA